MEQQEINSEWAEYLRKAYDDGGMLTGLAHAMVAVLLAWLHAHDAVELYAHELAKSLVTTQLSLLQSLQPKSCHFNDFKDPLSTNHCFLSTRAIA